MLNVSGEQYVGHRKKNSDAQGGSEADTGREGSALQAQKAMANFPSTCSIMYTVMIHADIFLCDTSDGTV